MKVTRLILASLSFSVLVGVLFLFFFASRYDTPPQSRTFLARNGEVIGTLSPAFSGIQTWVALPQIPPALIDSTLRHEDRFFYWHHGINPLAILKAFKSNLKGKSLRGGSTITQQLAKNLIQEKNCEKKSECIPLPRTLPQKILETTLALGLELKHSKSWILERYLNTIYYGHRCYGIDAASHYYFSKNLSDLSHAEMETLVSLPQAPSRVKKTNISSTRSWVGRHFMEFVSQRSTTSQPRLQTTLDLTLQQKAETAIQETLSERVLSDPKITAAAVVLDVRNGDILAMVGSRDYLQEDIQGQVNAATALRQPGSTLKPFTYFAAFNQGFSPDTVIEDQPTSFHIPANEDVDAYMPQNFDRHFHGNVTVRQALANSYNVPAVLMLNEIGLSYYHEILRRFGFTSLTKPPTYYGLSVTLGSGEVSLLELTNAYAALARGGQFLPYRFQPTQHSTPLSISTQSFSSAAKITDILSDPEARLKAFGFNENLTIEGHPVAVKTGTSYEHHDNWTVGYTPSYAVGVWVGHADGSPLDLTTGATGAAPIWHALMEGILRGTRPEYFPQAPRDTSAPTLRSAMLIENSQAKTWKVTSPTAYAHYRSNYLPQDHQGLTLSARAWKEDTSLSWYLDGDFLQTTEKDHKLWIQPIPGKHHVTVVSITPQGDEQKEDIPFFVSGDPL